jgi:hypothetical protein
MSSYTVRKRRTVPVLRTGVMMACNRRAEACAAIVHAEATAQRVSAAPSPDRFPPNSGSTASLLGNTNSGHCAGKATHSHILDADTHISFSIERTTERSWR